MNRSTRPSSQRLLLQYTGMAARFLAVIGILAYLGLRGDSLIDVGFPVLVWVLPLTGIVGLVVKAVVDTGKKRT
jgi:hypothetical protein